MEINKQCSPSTTTTTIDGGVDQVVTVTMPLDDDQERNESVHSGDGLLGPSPVSTCMSKEVGDNNPAVVVSCRNNINECKAIVLNPDAEEWDFRRNRAPEEDRCLFLTFSNGYPLTHAQIISFFTRKYGRCVERVYVHNPEPRRKPPLFGKAVFHSSLIPAMVMGNETQVKFMVDQRPLWCKRFEPRNSRRDSTG